MHPVGQESYWHQRSGQQSSKQRPVRHYRHRRALITLAWAVSSSKMVPLVIILLFTLEVARFGPDLDGNRTGDWLTSAAVVASVAAVLTWALVGQVRHATTGNLRRLRVYSSVLLGVDLIVVGVSIANGAGTETAAVVTPVAAPQLAIVALCVASLRSGKQTSVETATVAP